MKRDTTPDQREAPPSGPSPCSSEAARELPALFDEVVALFQRLKAVAEELYEGGPGSGSLRGVLRSLTRTGPQTVPQMARKRPVSRQYMQKVVDRLAAEGYVEFVRNPAHKRSQLVQLTDEGRHTCARLEDMERRSFQRFPVGLDAAEARRTIRALRSVRESLEAADIQSVLAGEEDEAPKPGTQ